MPAPDRKLLRNLLLGIEPGVLQLFPEARPPDRHSAVMPQPCSSRDGLCAHQGLGSPTQTPPTQPSQKSWTEAGEVLLLSAGSCGGK